MPEPQHSLSDEQLGEQVASLIRQLEDVSDTVVSAVGTPEERAVLAAGRHAGGAEPSARDDSIDLDPSVPLGDDAAEESHLGIETHIETQIGAQIDTQIDAMLSDLDVPVPTGESLDLDILDEPDEPVSLPDGESWPAVAVAPVEASIRVDASTQPEPRFGEPESPAPEPEPSPDDSMAELDEAIGAAALESGVDLAAPPTTADELDAELECLADVLLEGDFDDVSEVLERESSDPSRKPPPPSIAEEASPEDSMAELDAVLDDEPAPVLDPKPAPAPVPAPSADAPRPPAPAPQAPVLPQAAAAVIDLPARPPLTRTIAARAVAGLRASATLISRPLDDRPGYARDIVGWFAAVTLFNAIAVWVFTLVLRDPPPREAGVPEAGLAQDEALAGEPDPAADE
jgi:hypothetical protein